MNPEPATHLLEERDGPLTWIILNRPDRRNAFTDQMLEDLRLRLAELGRDPTTKVIAIRGAGDCFSVGHQGYSTPGSESTGPNYEVMGAAGDQARLGGWLQGWLEIWDNPKPVIAAVHGACYSHAATICVFCDITIVAEDADIGRRPAVPLGGGYHMPLWAWHVGWKRSKEMEFLQGKKITGTQAAEWGWANYAVPADELISNVSDMGREIGRFPSEVLRVQKMAHNRIAELQGFRLSVPMGADYDSILHFSSSVTRMRKMVREIGYEEAAKRFLDGSAGLED